MKLGLARVFKQTHGFQCLFLNKVLQLLKAHSHSQWTSVDIHSASMLWSNRTLSNKLKGLRGNPQTYTQLLLFMSYSLTYISVLFINY